MVKINDSQHVTKSGSVRRNPPRADFYEKVILDAIDTDGFESEPYYTSVKSPKAKLQFLKGRFMSEYGWAVERMGAQRALEKWYSGLAIDLPYYNSDIIKLAQRGGSLSDNPSEAEEDRILDNYWNFMANHTLKMFRKYGVE